MTRYGHLKFGRLDPDLAFAMLYAWREAARISWTTSSPEQMLLAPCPCVGTRPWELSKRPSSWWETDT